MYGATADARGSSGGLPAATLRMSAPAFTMPAHTPQLQSLACPQTDMARRSQPTAAPQYAAISTYAAAAQDGESAVPRSDRPTSSKAATNRSEPSKAEGGKTDKRRKNEKDDPPDDDGDDSSSSSESSDDYDGDDDADRSSSKDSDPSDSDEGNGDGEENRRGRRKHRKSASSDEDNGDGEENRRGRRKSRKPEHKERSRRVVRGEGIKIEYEHLAKEADSIVLP